LAATRRGQMDIAGGLGTDGYYRGIPIPGISIWQLMVGKGKRQSSLWKKMV